jgi:hypothetical protein
MKMYRCYGPGCIAHKHEVGLGGWILWDFHSTTDRYFCSRECYLNRMVEFMGIDQARAHIDALWFRPENPFDGLEEAWQDAADELAYLEELLMEEHG